MDKNLINRREIISISDFMEDKTKQNYGFTIMLQDGSIKNYFVKGKYYLKKNEIEQLKVRFRLINENLKEDKNSEEEN